DAPVGLRGPRRRTIASRHARFTWRAAPRSDTVGFRCSLDGRRFTRCASGVRYGPLKPGRHSFSVVALDARGRESRPAIGDDGRRPPSWSWRLVRARTMRISGDVTAALYPGGAPRPIDLTLHDPYGYALVVERLSVSIRSVSAPRTSASLPCGAADFRTGEYTGRALTTRPGSHTLEQDHVPVRLWPTIAMVDLASNQDGCGGAVLHLAYHGLAARAGAGRRVGAGGR
ncbi:MAG: hypothetical protein ACYCYN_12410, partial [Solirubrobacteraceae bacterium]